MQNQQKEQDYHSFVFKKKSVALCLDKAEVIKNTENQNQKFNDIKKGKNFKNRKTWKFVILTTKYICYIF